MHPNTFSKKGVLFHLPFKHCVIVLFMCYLRVPWG